MSVGILRIFSGIQPSGAAHLGNYLGAIRHWVQLQSRCDSILYSIVDLHSLTTLQAPMILRENIISMVTCLLACGVDPKKSILFQQSQVPEHSELAWLLGCRTPMGWLNRMTQWKAKAMSDNTNVVGLGLFAYPVLQAADILLYNSSHVPVGEDQIQHLELARDIARSFNSSYTTPIFIEPQPLLSEVNRVMSLRNPLQKMSKSDNQDMTRINLSDSPDDIRNKIRKSVTDCTGQVTFDPEERPGVSNLISIYSALCGRSTEDVCRIFVGKQTVDLKDELAELLINELAPIHLEISRLEADRGYVLETLKEGRDRAQEIAKINMIEIKRIIGIKLS